MNESEIHAVLSQALDADESKDEVLAISLYMKTVEMILQLEDKEARTRLNKYATQALDRAEELKGIKRKSISSPSVHVQPTVPVKSECYILAKFYPFYLRLFLKTRPTFNRHWDYPELMFTLKRRKKFWSTHHTSIRTYSFLS